MAVKPQASRVASTLWAVLTSGACGLPSLIRSTLQLLRDTGYMTALELGLGEFLGAWLTGAIRTRNAGGPLGRATFDLAGIAQFRAGVGQADVNEPMVDQCGNKTGNRGFITSTGAGAGENAAHFTNKGTFAPKVARVVKERPHLGSHVAKTRWWAEDDRIIVSQFAMLNEFARLKRFAMSLGAG